MVGLKEEKLDIEHVEDNNSDRSGNFSTDDYNSHVPDDTQYQFLGMTGKRLRNSVSLMAGMGFLLFGYDQGVMGSLLTLKSFKETFQDMDTSKELDAATRSKNSTWQGFVVAVYEIGCFAGAIATMYLGDKLGRRKMIFIGCIIMIIGAVIQTASYSSGQLLAARIITGIGNGMNTATVPVWQAECAKPEARGRLVMIAGALISGGIMISYWIDFAFYWIKENSVSWRFPLAFQILFPLGILPFILKMPESPRWLLKRGNTKQAIKVFSALEGTPANDPAILDQINQVDESIAAERHIGGEAKNGIYLLFTQGKHRNFHRAMLGIWAQIMQQISGINLITYYAGTIFEQYLGMTTTVSRILAACNGTEYFIASWIAFYTIERFGRRNLMLFGAAGQAITMGILTGTTWYEDNTSALIAAVVFLFVFNTFFAIGWLGMTWLYPAEVTPLNVRAPANGISTASNWIFNFMVVMITPIAFDSIKSNTYTIFAAINALMVPTVYFLYPETSGKTLEDIDKIFEQCDPWKPWQVVRIADELPRK